MWSTFNKTMVDVNKNNFNIYSKSYGTFNEVIPEEQLKKENYLSKSAGCNVQVITEEFYKHHPYKCSISSEATDNDGRNSKERAADDVSVSTRSDNDDDQSTVIPKTSLRFTKHQWMVLLSIGYINFTSNASISLLSSFFPQEAEAHGASLSEIGLIFGCYAIVTTICCPLFGCLVPKIGAKLLFLIGQLIAGIFSFLFSQLYLVKWPPVFVSMCFLFRAIQAMGCAAYYTASTVLINKILPNNMNFAMGFCEMLCGFGMIVGPLLGGWFYEIGGFQLPFIAIGVMMFFGMTLNYFVIKHDHNPAPIGNFFMLFKNPNIIATTLLTVLMASALDFNMPLLSSHMKNLPNHSPVLVGIMFVVMAVSYGIVSIIIGICVKTKIPGRITMIVGGLFIVLGFLLIGPSTIFEPIKFQTLTMTSLSISLLVIGIGLGLGITPTFSDLMFSAVGGGMMNDASTSGVVGGLFYGSIFFGEFIGPVLGGALMDYYKDFRITSTIFSGIVFIVSIIVAIYYTVDIVRDRLSRGVPAPSNDSVKSSPERRPLLN